MLPFHLWCLPNCVPIFLSKVLQLVAKQCPKKPEEIKDAEDMSRYFTNLYPAFSGFK